MNQAIRQMFWQSIRIGTGQAILLLKAHPAISFDDLICEACTRNLAYDPQCEGTRVDYLFEILSLAKDKEKIEDRIIEKLRVFAKDDWDIYLLFDLVGKITLSGNRKAKKVLYERYNKGLEENYEFTDIDTLVEIDGLKGLEFSAEIQGKLLQQDSEFWITGWLINVCKEQVPGSNPRQYLLEKSQKNDDIKSYLNAVDECEKKTLQL